MRLPKTLIVRFSLSLRLFEGRGHSDLYRNKLSRLRRVLHCVRLPQRLESQIQQGNGKVHAQDR